MTIDYKSIFQSKTLIGLVIAAVPTVAGWVGLTVTPADASEFTTNVMAYGEQAMAAFGWALAFYGRIVATKKLAVA